MGTVFPGLVFAFACKRNDRTDGVDEILMATAQDRRTPDRDVIMSAENIGYSQRLGIELF